MEQKFSWPYYLCTHNLGKIKDIIWHAYIRSPQKNEPPMRGSLALSEFVPKNQGYPIWRNDFGAKNGAQAKRRVEAY